MLTWSNSESPRAWEEVGLAGGGGGGGGANHKESEGHIISFILSLLKKCLTGDIIICLFRQPATPSVSWW